MQKKIYMVWQGGENEQFFNQFETIEDAVYSEGDVAEVYVAEPKYLGKFKRKVEMVKIKKRKKKTK